MKIQFLYKLFPWAEINMLLPTRILDSKQFKALKKSEKLIYCILAVRANTKNNNKTTVSQLRIQKDVGASEKTVVNAVRKLEKAGLIKRKINYHRYKKIGDTTGATTYTVFLPVPELPVNFTGSYSDQPVKNADETSEQPVNFTPIIEKLKQTEEKGGPLPPVSDETQKTESAWHKHQKISRIGSHEEYLLRVQAWLTAAPAPYWTEMAKDFPDIDVISEANAAYLWLKNNPDDPRYKFNSFLCSWFRKSTTYSKKKG